MVGKIAIVGHGIIGRSWAVVFARAGFEVDIWDHAAAGLERILTPIAATFAALEGTTLCGPAGSIDRIRIVPTLEAALEGAVYVQESVPERLDLKPRVLKRIDAICPAETVIASSTSGILPSVLGQGLTHRARFLVAHPLTPPHLLPVVELVPSSFTASATTAFARDLLCEAGQRPIVLQAEINGFVANRLLAALLNEYFLLIRDGVLRAEDADALMVDGFALRWAGIGPFAAMDLNAAGGIGEYLRRYGGMFESIVAERGTAAGLDEQVVARLTHALQDVSGTASVDQRIAERDRLIARLRSARGG